MIKPDGLVRLDLNGAEFQESLFSLSKPERHSAMETLKKLRQMDWNQVYRDHGLKWQKIASIVPPQVSQRYIRCHSRNPEEPLHAGTAFLCGFWISHPIITRPTAKNRPNLC
jgi:hypothetical protein